VIVTAGQPARWFAKVKGRRKDWWLSDVWPRRLPREKPDFCGGVTLEGGGPAGTAVASERLGKSGFQELAQLGCRLEFVRKGYLRWVDLERPRTLLGDNLTTFPLRPI
jgi:hypothetical protein